MPNAVGNKGKYIQEISEGTTKQISSSFLLIAFINVTELQIIWWKSFTVYIKHTQGWILFCTQQNCHAYKSKVTSSDRDKA